MIDDINRLSKIVFKNEPHLANKFNQCISEKKYNSARVITEALRVIYPKDNTILDLDSFVTEMCIINS